MTATISFDKLGLDPLVLSALKELGYETPTPIQERSIPVLMENNDLLAQAQTGTGKTAAFALPILSHIDLTLKKPQAIIIAPTRELAIQVAEAFQSYAKHFKGFHVTPIYGGQDYRTQLKALQRGSHVIVGTPGRVMDHLRRGSLCVKSIRTLVLDEADEMLKMGFIDDVEWILEQIPNTHQTALFSATMPTSIQKIAKRYLKDAEKIQIKSNSNAVDTIEQVYMRVSRDQKLDALTRYLEVEDVQATIIFARTKNCSEELAEKLKARGYEASALNGDMNQALREKVIGKIKRGTLDIIVATDVAARGIDVERVSHVINYDIPYDTESYIHRIGRTGRAGRKGKALLFVTPREHGLLKDIERAINKSIKQIDPPSLNEMKEIRSKQLAEKVLAAMANPDAIKPYYKVVKTILNKEDSDPLDVAVALAYLMEKANPMPSHEIHDAQPEFQRRKGRSGGRPGGRSGGRSDGFRGKPSGNSSRRSSGKPSDNSGRSGKPGGKPSGKPSKRSSAKSSDRFADKAPQRKSSERPSGVPNKKRRPAKAK